MAFVEYLHHFFAACSASKEDLMHVGFKTRGKGGDQAKEGLMMIRKVVTSIVLGVEMRMHCCFEVILLQGKVVLNRTRASRVQGWLMRRDSLRWPVHEL